MFIGPPAKLAGAFIMTCTYALDPVGIVYGKFGLVEITLNPGVPTETFVRVKLHEELSVDIYIV
jgi:hypothetical protein